MSNDSELLRQYVEQGSDQAFAKLVQSRIGLVYGIALARTRDAHLAEDVTQLVFTALASKAKSLVTHPALVGWLHRSAHFSATDAIRKRRRRMKNEQEIMAMKTLEEGSAGPDWEKIAPVLTEAVDALPSSDRDAVLLRYIDRLPYAEIGARMRLTENATRMRIDRALDRLRARLARRGIASTSAAIALILTDQAVAGAPAGLANVVVSAALGSAATSAGVAGSAISLIHLMSATQWAVIASAVAIVATGSALYEARSAQMAATTLQRVAAERDELQTQIRRLDRRTTPRPVEIGRPGDGGNSQAEVKLEALFTEISRQAHVALAIEPNKLVAMHRRYDAFVRSQGLSSSEADRFFETLNDWDMTAQDFQAAIRNQGLIDSPGVWAVRNRMQQQLEAAPLIAVLGETGYQAWRNYERSSVYQISEVDPLAQDLAVAQIPLSSVQNERLLTLFQSHQLMLPKTDPTQLGDRVMPDWPAVVDAASSFLSPGQLAVLKARAAKAKH